MYYVVHTHTRTEACVSHQWEWGAGGAVCEMIYLTVDGSSEPQKHALFLDYIKTKLI